MAKELDIAAIEKIIPHRYPMLLIDRVIDLEEGKSATAIHNVSFSEKFVQASSKSDPAFPSPLIVEAMAQTGAVALLSTSDFQGKTAYFGGIQKADFMREARPGDQVVLKTELTKIRKNIGVGKGIATIDRHKIAEAELTFMIG